MSIGTTYQPNAMSAIIGPAHSPEIPDVLWAAWYDASDVLVADTGVQISHDVFVQSATGVENDEVIDVGLWPAGTPAKLALMDAETGGAIVAVAETLTFPGDAPTEGDAVSIPVGSLRFTIG